MGFKCGIVGLPNVGKSTLFNALTQTAAAQAANYPFCTIEPNVGEIAVPDPRLDKLAVLGKSEQIIPTRITFVDIAGLVRGASKGEGLGNQFLATIREVDAIVHVVRCFEDSDVTHVEGKIDPIADIDTIETELMLADLDSLEKRVDALEKKAKGTGEDAKLPRKCSIWSTARSCCCARASRRAWSSASPRRKSCSTRSACSPRRRCSTPAMSRKRPPRPATNFRARSKQRAKEEGAVAVVISAKIESEIATLPPAERAEFLEAVGLKETGLDRLIRAGYALLHLVTYFTVGPKETRAWTITAGTKAPQAAGVIHSDFERGFIRSETIGYDDYIAGGGEAGARDAGKMRLEGKDYVVADGDVMHFRFAT